MSCTLRRVSGADTDRDLGSEKNKGVRTLVDETLLLIGVVLLLHIDWWAVLIVYTRIKDRRDAYHHDRRRLPRAPFCLADM